MPVHNTDKSVFDKACTHMAFQRRMANAIFTEEEYLITSNEEQLAVILKGKSGKKFGYVLLAKDGKDRYDLKEGKATFKTYDEAKKTLTEKMSE